MRINLKSNSKRSEIFKRHTDSAVRQVADAIKVSVAVAVERIIVRLVWVCPSACAGRSGRLSLASRTRVTKECARAERASERCAGSDCLPGRQVNGGSNRRAILNPFAVSSSDSLAAMSARGARIPIALIVVVVVGLADKCKRASVGLPVRPIQSKRLVRRSVLRSVWRRLRRRRPKRVR